MTTRFPIFPLVSLGATVAASAFSLPAAAQAVRSNTSDVMLTTKQCVGLVGTRKVPTAGNGPNVLEVGQPNSPGDPFAFSLQSVKGGSLTYIKGAGDARKAMVRTLMGSIACWAPEASTLDETT